MASLAQIRTKADEKLTTFWQALSSRQDVYFAKHGKYFQLLVTAPVVDGADTAWELRTPSDELHALDVGFTFNSPIPFSISVDEWVGDTVGYSVTATIKLLDGRIFSRKRDSNQVDSDWFEVLNVAIP